MSSSGLFGVKLFSGNAHPSLADKISKHLNIPLGKCSVGKFSNGETTVSINESVRGADVFLITTGSEPVNDNLMETYVMVDAFRRASAHRITVVTPCFPYARQDKKDKSRAPITAKLIAVHLQTAGVNRVITMDFHASQLQGFFDIPADNLYAEPVLLHALRMDLGKQLLGETVVVSPDAGGVKRAKSLADKLGVELTIIHKTRKVANCVDSMILIGEVKDKIAILIDDIADTCGTLQLAATTLKQNGAKRIYAMVTHGVLSGPSLQRIADSPIELLYCTNSMPLEGKIAACSKLVEVDIAPILAESIRRTHNGESISFLFDHEPL